MSNAAAGRRAALAAFGEAFPEFRPRQSFHFDEYPHWFIGSMSKGKVRIEQKMKDVDVLLEVRDCRAPFTTAQVDLTKDSITNRTQRLVVLNKADLVTPNVGLKMRQLIQETGQPCLLTNASENKNLIKIKEFALDHVRSKHPRTLGLMMMLIGLPNVGKSTIINGMKRIAFATSRRQGPNSKLMFGVKRAEARATGTPGETREVTFFQLSNFPRLYCYDTPGVQLQKAKNDPERNTKLALLGTMPDHFAGEMYLADYLLFRLNKAQMFEYVEELGLPGPTDDVRFLTAHVAMLLIQKSQTPSSVAWTNVTAGAQFFLSMFRLGRLGKICLDHVPGLDELQMLRSLRSQTEPPGPWGPPCYPEAPPGLELERMGPVLPAGFQPRRRMRGAVDDGEATG